MFKYKLLPISIIALAFSIIVATSIVSSGIETNCRYISDGIFQGENNINFSKEALDKWIEESNFKM